VNSLVLRTAARFLISLLLVFALFLLLRGHDEPGGGFVAGLVAAASVVLFSMAYDVPSARRFLRVDPRRLIWIGLLIAIGSGIPGMFTGDPFLTGQWADIEFGAVGTLHVGTPLLFDLGVFLVVVGVAVTLALTMAEE
jgi:multicomponent Na+:H+ antiporter subunit B